MGITARAAALAAQLDAQSDDSYETPLAIAREWVTGLFPVGAIFVSVVPTNPATLLGFGTWSAFATGRVLVGIDTTDPDFNVVEEIGGSKIV